MNWTDDRIYDYVSGQLSEDARVRLEKDATLNMNLRYRIDEFRTIHEALEGERERTRNLDKSVIEAVLNKIRDKN